MKAAKLLYIGNIAGKKMTGSFSGTAIAAAHELGFDYHSVANREKTSKEQMEKDQLEYGITIHHADIIRSPFSLKNIKAYKQIVEIIKREKIDCIHCNTPVGGMLGRLAGKKCGVKKVIYQAHGFHFYKGAPIKNWLMYYPVERMLAHLTDALITINREDYKTAQRFRLRDHGIVYYVPGVGIDPEAYRHTPADRERKRREMGVEDEVVFISMGDLIDRKNYETAIRAIAESGCRNVVYWICGSGPSEKKLKALIEEKDLSAQVRLLGYRSDIRELLAAADVFVLTSFQEGLPRSVLEAMASGLPCLASSIRGNVDIIENGRGGWLFGPKDVSGFAKGIRDLTGSPEMRKRMSGHNQAAIHQFDKQTVTAALRDIYKTEFDQDR